MHFRREQLPRPLWIDAICINQADQAEKEKQIPLMRHIYPNAQLVRLWLDISIDMADPAFEAIQKLAEIEEDDPDEAQDGDDAVPISTLASRSGVRER